MYNNAKITNEKIVHPILTSGDCHDNECSDTRGVKKE